MDSANELWSLDFPCIMVIAIMKKLIKTAFYSSWSKITFTKGSVITLESVRVYRQKTIFLIFRNQITTEASGHDSLFVYKEMGFEQCQGTRTSL